MKSLSSVAAAEIDTFRPDPPPDRISALNQQQRAPTTAISRPDAMPRRSPLGFIKTGAQKPIIAPQYFKSRRRRYRSPISLVPLAQKTLYQPSKKTLSPSTQRSTPLPLPQYSYRRPALPHVLPTTAERPATEEPAMAEKQAPEEHTTGDQPRTEESLVAEQAAAEQRITADLPDAEQQPAADQPAMDASITAAQEADLTTIEPTADVRYGALPNYTRALEHLQYRDNIHVLGFSHEARYLAYCLAGTPELPPAQILVHDQKVIARWHMEQKKISVYDRNGLLNSHAIRSPQPITNAGQLLRGSHIIHNLVVDAGTAVVERNIYRIRHRITADTVICLVNGGLGLMEHLNETVFPDPDRRPTYMLGQMTHMVYHGAVRGSMLSVRLRSLGKLYLTVVDSNKSHGDGHAWTRMVGHARARHLTKLLLSVPGLHAQVESPALFLRHKLPPMVFSAATDAVSVILRCRYEDIHRTAGPRELWHSLVQETAGIIASLPELQSSPDMVDYFQGYNFQERMMQYLKRQKGMSKWVKRLHEGQAVPIQYVNGWFVRQAVKTGAVHTLNAMAVSVVKARRTMVQQQLWGEIPMYTDTQMEGIDEEDGNAVRTKYVYLPREKKNSFAK